MSGKKIIDGIAFSIEGLKRDADEIEACGAGNEAAQMRWAAAALLEARAEVERLREALERIGGVRGPYGNPFPEANPDYGAFAVVTAREALEAKNG